MLDLLKLMLGGLDKCDQTVDIVFLRSDDSVGPP